MRKPMTVPPVQFFMTAVKHGAALEQKRWLQS